MKSEQTTKSIPRKPVESTGLVLIDGYALIYQSFYAIRNLTSPTGEPTNAVFGFLTQLRKVLGRHPRYIAVALDRAEPTFRHKMYPDYKATRKPMPEDLQTQIPMIEKLLEAYRIPVVSRAGYEADDVIATLARLAEKDPDFVGAVDICTTDKDADQLISEQIRILEIRTGRVTDLASLKETKGIRPEQVIEVFGLGGDSSDNIPGVPGIGPKTATELIDRYGTLEGVLEHVDDIRGDKRKENLKKYADQARLSRELARLDTEVPLEVTLSDMEWVGPDAKRLMELFGQWGFRKFTDELVAEMPTTKLKVHLVDSPETFESFLDELKKQKRVSVDLETTSLMPLEAEIVGLSFSWSAGEGYYLPLMGPLGSKLLPARKTLDALSDILTDGKVAKVGQNLKYDSLVLRGAGIELNPIAFDTMVASYTLNPGRMSHSLDNLARNHLGRNTIPIKDLIGSGRKQITMDAVPTERVAEYAVEDAEVAWSLMGVLSEQIETGGFEKLYEEVELPLIQVLRDMELVGIRVDTDLLGEMSEEFEGRLAELAEAIYKEAGSEFNIASTQQLGKVLFEDLKLPSRRKTKSGYSTDQGVLESIRALHPLPELVLEHRSLSKLKSTYIDALPRMVNRKTGRIHASFNQTVTSTGRLSSSDPNLQNIPIRTEQGGRIRRAFIPGKSNQLLLSADYSQIELRLLAHFSQDPELTRAFNEDADIHAFVAAQVNKVELSEVTPEQRRQAKTVNFGIMYGLSPHGLSQQLGIGVDQARDFIEHYYQRYRGVAEFFHDLLSDAHKAGYVTTILKRKCYVKGVRDPGTVARSSSRKRRDYAPASDVTSFRQLNQAERFAINATCQGSAADLIKVAMINLHRKLQQGTFKTRMLLQIHDELVFEVPHDELESVIDLVRVEMSDSIKLRVPMVVNIGTGKNWLEVK